MTRNFVSPVFTYKQKVALCLHQWLVANNISYVGEKPPIQMQQVSWEMQSASSLEQPIHTSLFLVVLHSNSV